jgi:hypothetical protein
VCGTLAEPSAKLDRICREAVRATTCHDPSVTSSDPHGWRFVHLGFDGSDVTVASINPRDYKWQSTGEAIEVRTRRRTTYSSSGGWRRTTAR